MAPQPYTASGRLNIIIVTNSLTHKVRFPVQIDPASVPDGNTILSRVAPGTPIATLSAAQEGWNTIRQVFGTDVAAPSYLIERNVSGVFIPLIGGPLTGAGTAGGTTQTCSEIIFSFASTSNHRWKLFLAEVGVLPPFHLPGGTAVSPYADIIDDVVNPANTSDIGSWVVSRGTEVIGRATGVTSSLNKRIRRSRHLT